MKVTGGVLGLAVVTAVAAAGPVDAQRDPFAPGDRPVLERLPTCVAATVTGACFDFEGSDSDQWLPAGWAIDQADYVHGSVMPSTAHASRNRRSIRLDTRFTRRGWSATALELRTRVSLQEVTSISADIFVPDSSPGLSLAARVAIIAGGWEWIEMRESVPLEAGRWTTIEVPLSSAGATEGRWSMSGARLHAALSTVHRIILRIEADVAGSVPAPVSIYVDNIWFKHRR